MNDRQRKTERLIDIALSLFAVFVLGSIIAPLALLLRNEGTWHCENHLNEFKLKIVAYEKCLNDLTCNMSADDYIYLAKYTSKINKCENILAKELDNAEE